MEWLTRRGSLFHADFTYKGVIIPRRSTGNSHLADVKQRHSEKTFQEKRGAFARFFSEMDISPDLPVEEIKPSQCKKFLSQQDETRSGYAANKDRKNLATGWDWGRVNFEEETICIALVIFRVLSMPCILLFICRSDCIIDYLWL